MRRNAKVDENQPEIVEALRKAGAFVVITSQLKNAFDILVAFRGKLFIMEIKDGEKPPSARKLTDGETKCKEGIEGAGCTYHIVLSVEEALNVINENKWCYAPIK